jgi:hypothetical protein
VWSDSRWPALDSYNHQTDALPSGSCHRASLPTPRTAWTRFRPRSSWTGTGSSWWNDRPAARSVRSSENRLGVRWHACNQMVQTLYGESWPQRQSALTNLPGSCGVSGGHGPGPLREGVPSLPFRPTYGVSDTANRPLHQIPHMSLFLILPIIAQLTSGVPLQFGWYRDFSIP